MNYLSDGAGGTAALFIIGLGNGLTGNWSAWDATGGGTLFDPAAWTVTAKIAPTIPEPHA